MEIIKIILKKILDFLLPQSEKVCRLEKITANELVAKSRKADEIEIPETFAVFSYKDPLVKELIWQLKYRGNEKAVKLLGEIMADEITNFIHERELFENFQKPLVIPIPLAPKRLKERGFNQCEFICRETLAFGIPAELASDILAKTKETPSQARTKDREERARNLRGSFTVLNPNKAAGRNIILLDDVITTGATVQEARRALLSAGARKVVAYAVAH